VPPDKKSKKKRPRTGRTARLDRRMAKALGHPLRCEIIAILNDTCASPSEMADMLDEPLSNVSYHTNELRKLKCIEMVDQEKVRGSVKTRYRATMKMLLDNPDWERLSKAARTAVSVNAMNEVSRRAADAMEAGTFDGRTDRTLITLKLDVDEQAWLDVNKALRVAYERIEDIKVEAATRKAEGVETFRMTASLLGYPSPLREVG
jgi:DNA-binding transcriptional ArsR family regulator